MVKHANDLRREGSVERLHHDLASQPVHIRGGALVDPLQLQQELVARTCEVLEVMGDYLKETAETAHGLTPISAAYLESCLETGPASKPPPPPPSASDDDAPAP